MQPIVAGTRMAAAERKYALTKIAPGDYLLPSNDAQALWRIARYTDGPSNGLDWPRDREVWGLWRWNMPMGQSGYVDTGSWDHWEMVDGPLYTRAEAITEALRIRRGTR